MKKKKKVAPLKRRTKEAIKADLPPISLFVRNRREELGYTQEEFERGKKTVRLDKVNDLLEFLGASLEVKIRKRG